jgi:hypothetical protein
MTERNDRAAHDALDRASTGIVTALRGDLLDAPSSTKGESVLQLNGALVDALRSRRPE